MKHKVCLVIFGLLTSITTAASSSNTDGSGKPSSSEKNIVRYTFSWPYADGSELTPRGGTTKGPEVQLNYAPAKEFLNLQVDGLVDKDRDRLAIISMAGDYRTSFDFIETMGFMPNYKPPKPYQSWGTERVYLIEDSEDFISLQHILVMRFESDEGKISEPMVVKHWRQDWRYEDTATHDYQGHGVYERHNHREEDIRGYWTQTVYQVDDSPRYEAMGKWHHRTGLSEWQSTEKRRPLPRREFSVRNDYQVLLGRHRITVTYSGWIQEEDSLKLALKTNNEQAETGAMLAREAGISRYERITGYNFDAGDVYWEKTESFWRDVRTYWSQVYESSQTFEVKKRVDGEIMFATLFDMADRPYENSESRQQMIKQTLRRFVQHKKVEASN
jgi:hypothetical protein